MVKIGHNNGTVYKLISIVKLNALFIENNFCRIHYNLPRLFAYKYSSLFQKELVVAFV